MHKPSLCVAHICALLYISWHANTHPTEKNTPTCVHPRCTSFSLILPHRHPSLSSLLLLPCLFRGMRLAGCVWWPDSKSLSHSPKKFPPFFSFLLTWLSTPSYCFSKTSGVYSTHTHTHTPWSHCWCREYQSTPLLFPPSEPLLWSISVCCGQQGVCAFAALPSKIQTFQGSQQYNMVALL